MRIQTRLTNVKGHTTGFKIGGKNRSRKEAVQLAQSGKIEGVVVRKGGSDSYYIAAAPGLPALYNLPERVVVG